MNTVRFLIPFCLQKYELRNSYTAFNPFHCTRDHKKNRYFLTLCLHVSTTKGHLQGSHLQRNTFIINGVIYPHM
jgi:hypothetical protein